MGFFSFTTDIKEDRILQLSAGTPMGRVTVAITPADEAAPTQAGFWPSCWTSRPLSPWPRASANSTLTIHWSVSVPAALRDAALPRFCVLIDALDGAE